MNFKQPQRPSLSIIMFLLIQLLICTSISLKLNQLNHRQLHTLQSKRGFEHYGSASMSINYSEEIVKLCKCLTPAMQIHQRISKVQKQYLGHEQQVKILANYNFTELNTNQINCKNLSADTLQSLSFRTTEMKQYLLHQLEVNQINFISDLKIRQSAKKSIQSQITYLKGLQKFLQSGCTKNVKITQSYFISNPNANNWILGSWNYDEFINVYISTMNSQQKITKCPLQLPFFDSISKQCINCQYPNNIWNMKQNKCTACPYAQIVNLKTKKCVSEIHYINNLNDEDHPWITDQKSLPKVFEQFNKEKLLQNAVVCPFDTPFILNEKCSTCSEGFAYSLDEKKCQKIPYNMRYDKNIHKIVQKLQEYQTSEAISSNVQQGLKGCPSNYPYYDNITCIDCSFPNFFNQRKKSCEPCLNLNICGQKKETANYVTNSLAPNVTGKNTTEVRKYFSDNAQKFKNESISQCQIKTPYYNPSLRKCMNCTSQKPYFNISLFQCVNCPSGSTYNRSSYLCQLPKGGKTFSKADFLIIDNQKKYRQQQSKITAVQCPQNLPYFDGKSCIKCQSGFLFNTTSKNCVQCPNNTNYDNVLFKCDVIKYKTNSLTNKLWIPNIIEYQNAYKNNTGKQCPVNLPFFNGVNCIDCSKQEIFNTTSLKCTKCPQKTTFDNINKNCSVTKLKFYIPGKTDNLLGTPTYSVSKYLEEIEAGKKGQNEIVKCADNQNSKKTGCIKCDQNFTFFNVKTLECVKCNNFDKQKSICYDNITYLTNTTKSEKFIGQNDGDVSKFILDQEKKIKQNPDLYQSCPFDKPVIINKTCQSCSKYYDVISQNCIDCDNYNSQSKTCPSKQYISNLKYGVPPYYTQNASKLLQSYDKALKNGTQVCPFKTPFFNGRQCIICPTTDQYFNIDNKKCQNCTKGYQFNTIINQCQQDPPKFYTALESQRLVFDGQPIEYYKFKIQQAVKAGSQKCPVDKPYYTKNNQCQTCKQPTPYFNMLRRICVSCPQKTTYVPQDHQCQSPIGDIVTPQATLQKSLANLFT